MIVISVSMFFDWQVRVHAPPNDYDRLDYALETSVKLLSYYEKLFGEPFPLPKLGEWGIWIERFFGT